MTDYDKWNHAIAAEFFAPEHDGRPAPLAVDADTLRATAKRIGIPADEAVDRFTAAVTERRPDGMGFAWFARAQRKWQQSDRRLHMPPTIALLGLCVLAASRMERDLDAGVASHNYYARLNALLGRPAGSGMPGGFGVVAAFWKDLSDWLDHDLVGARGKSTIRPHHWHVNVGYPISQALLRRVDRHRLTDFFRSAGLRPGDQITTEELWALLQVWVHASSGLTSYGLHAIVSADDRLAGALADVVKTEFDAWDGSLRDPEGRQIGTVALRLKGRAGWHSVEMSLLPRRPDGFPTGTFTTTGGRSYELTSSMRGEWYDLLKVGVDARLLERGLTLRRGQFAVRFQPALVMPLRASIELGGWVSVPRLAALEDHLLLVHLSKLENVKRLLAKSGDGRHTISQMTGIPSNWRLVRDVRVVEEAGSNDPVIGPVTPRLGLTVRLEGGLEVGPALFLTEGEPDLWVSVTQGNQIELEVDDVRRRWPGTIRRVALKNLGLDVGNHRVETAGRIIRLATCDGLPVQHQPRTGVLGYELQRPRQYRPSTASAIHLDETPKRGTVQIIGAVALGAAEDLPLPPNPPVLLRHGFNQYTLLGARPGEVTGTSEPPIPPWLKLGLAEDVCQFFDVPCPFTPELVVMEGVDGSRLRAVRASPRAAVQHTETFGVEDVNRWGETVVAAEERGIEVPPELSQLWLTYLDAARGSTR